MKKYSSVGAQALFVSYSEFLECGTLLLDTGCH